MMMMMTAVADGDVDMDDMDGNKTSIYCEILFDIVTVILVKY